MDYRFSPSAGVMLTNAAEVLVAVEMGDGDHIGPGDRSQLSIRWLDEAGVFYKYLAPPLVILFHNVIILWPT